MTELKSLTATMSHHFNATINQTLRFVVNRLNVEYGTGHPARSACKRRTVKGGFKNKSGKTLMATSCAILDTLVGFASVGGTGTEAVA